jgi:PAS domain S-box-containing protein
LTGGLSSRAFLDGGGQVGALMRGHDWSASPLGPPEGWPQSLRSVVGLLLNSKFPMFVAWGEELGFLYNDAYAEILAGKHPRALGARFHDIWSEIWPDIWPLIEAALAGRASFRENLPLTMNRKGYDEDTWFTFSYSPVRDESGAVAGMFCAVEETTAHILAERRLIDSETRFRHLADAMPQLVWTADASGRVDYYNARRQHYRGIEERVPGAWDWLSIVHPEDETHTRIAWASALSRGEAFTCEHRLALKDGNWAWHVSRAVCARDAAGATKWYGTAIDVSELKSAQHTTEALNASLARRIEDALAEQLKDHARLADAEEQLHQVQKMETLGQLTGGVAHDFNNLLTPIVGALDLMRRHREGDERAQRLASHALNAADRARMLIQRLLAFSRRQHLEPRPVDIAELIEGLTDLVARSLGPRIELVFDVAESLPPALVDPNQLELALLNLAVNSRDAMGGDGTLTIAAKAQSLSGGTKLKPGDYLRISVTDTGAGMDEDTLRRAVEPFFTTKAMGRGTGLGLSTVHGLAEQSGGEFSLESQAGHGTTATLWLPVATGARSVLPAISDAEVTVAKADATPVLLVDDEELVRAATAEMLLEAGYRVTQAASGYEALRLLEGGLNIAALVTDFAMPGMAGLQLAREALALRPDLQVLMITGYANFSEQEAGGLKRLAKPFRQADLAAAVGDLLRVGKTSRLPPRVA